MPHVAAQCSPGQLVKHFAFPGGRISLIFTFREGETIAQPAYEWLLAAPDEE
jgi:hypothetical protein